METQANQNLHEKLFRIYLIKCSMHRDSWLTAMMILSGSKFRFSTTTSITASHNVEPDSTEAIKLGIHWKWQSGLSNELRLILNKNIQH
jgi:hypothetical protein